MPFSKKMTTFHTENIQTYLMKNIFLLLFGLIVGQLSAQNIEGTWHGLLEIPGKPLKISFHIEKNEGKFSATMDVPEQGAKGLPMNTIAFENNKLVMSLEMAGIVYEGIWENDEKINGKFMQGGMALTLNLSRKEQTVEKPKRPQTPQPPFDYIIEDVVFENTLEKFKLGGTLTLPKNKDFKSIVILISGSGQQNRNSVLFDHAPFWVIADYLTKNGIAVLRYDDRGVGQSGGDVMKATSANFAEDVLSAVQFLTSKPEFKTKKIILAGHSEGGLIAPIVASKSKEVDGVILLAGPGVAGDVILKEQSYLIGKASGLSEQQLQKSKATNEKIYAIIKTTKDLELAKTDLRPILESEFEGLPAAQKSQAVEQQLASICSLWFQYFVKYDPKMMLSQLKIPVLALNGEKDLQVPAQLNIDGIKANCGSKNLTTKIYPNLNHLFQIAKTGNVSEYATIEETFNEVVLADIKNWILNLK